MGMDTTCEYVLKIKRIRIRRERLESWWILDSESKYHIAVDSTMGEIHLFNDPEQEIEIEIGKMGFWGF